jgi:predicted ABC-type ATPase
VREILILAGPNGAGKTTFANEFLRIERKNLVFVNADEIAREVALPPAASSDLDRHASREMLAQFETLVADGRSFMFETTLASLTYAQKIKLWRQNGYTIALIYLRLPSVEVSLQRVQKRVEAGGHGIPREVILRRFAKSAAYLENIYKPVVDEWYIWDSLDDEFRLAESWTAR